MASPHSSSEAPVRPPTKQASAVFVYDFRLSESNTTSDHLCKILPRIAKKWVFQLEEGEQTGYRHFQGKLTLHKKARSAQVVKCFKDLDVHVNYCQPSASREGFDYVMKIQTRVEGPWSNQSTSYIPKRVRVTDDQLRPWQQQLLHLAIPDDRHIDFIWCTHGNLGKSFLALYLHSHNRGISLPPINDSKELVQTCCDILMAKELREPGIVLVDLPRAMPQHKMSGVYQAIEQIKNGHVQDVRHHYREWLFEPPAVIVFCNTPPLVKQLSKDRWRVWTFDDTTLVPFDPFSKEYVLPEDPPEAF